MLIYLSGSIEFSGDFGRGWRADLTPFLLGLGHRVYDPAADEQKNLTEEEVAHFREWKTADPERFAETIRAFGGFEELKGFLEHGKARKKERKNTEGE